MGEITGEEEPKKKKKKFRSRDEESVCEILTKAEKDKVVVDGKDVLDHPKSKPAQVSSEQSLRADIVSCTHRGSIRCP